MKQVVSLTTGLLLLAQAAPGWAQLDERSASRQKASQQEGEQARVAWRNSTIAYENVVSALSFSEGAEQTYNPYYAQSLSFQPRYYVRDDLSLRARLDLEIELTTSDSTDHAREWVLSDLTLDMVYAPSWMTIPVLEVGVSPSLRLGFPTSIVSRGRSLMLTLAPGLTLRRSFTLSKGRFLRSLGLTYGFRATKYLHEYTTAQVNTSGICSLTNLDNPACLHSGYRNQSWRLGNSFGARLELMEKLSLSLNVTLLNDLLHKLEGGSYAVEHAPEIELGTSSVNHRAAVWGIFDVSYDVLEWLWLSAGISTYHPQLKPTSEIRAPLLNRYSAFYFDVTVPIDRFVDQVRSWARR